MTAFADQLDLRAAVIEQVANPDIADVFPRLVKLAESEMSRRLRTDDQITSTQLVVATGAVALPTDYAAPLGLIKASGAEMVQMSIEAYNRLASRDGFYAVAGREIKAPDAEYTLTYYAKIPTISGAMGDSNWCLQKYPALYLYAVASQAAKHMRDVEMARDLIALAGDEFAEASAQDTSERFDRARVRVGGVTP